MSFLKRYIRLHIRFLMDIYQNVLLRTDKHVFAVLFNLKSILYGSSSRLSWNGSSFSISDNTIPNFSFKFKHRRQGNMAYERGVPQRAENLADAYFLRKINFNNGDIFLDCGANVGDLKLWFMLGNIDVEYIGFEPSPIEFNCLKENVHPSEVHNVGLWNENGELDFYVNSQKADSSLIEPKEYDEVIISKVLRLEQFVDGTVKCLKLEAEGAEPEVLDGLGEKLKLIEFITADLGFERGVNAESVLAPVTNYLLQRGFELVDLSYGRVCVLYRNKSFS